MNVRRRRRVLGNSSDSLDTRKSCAWSNDWRAAPASRDPFARFRRRCVAARARHRSRCCACARLWRRSTTTDDGTRRSRRPLLLLLLPPPMHGVRACACACATTGFGRERRESYDLGSDTDCSRRRRSRPVRRTRPARAFFGGTRIPRFFRANRRPAGRLRYEGCPRLEKPYPPRTAPRSRLHARAKFSLVVSVFSSDLFARTPLGPTDIDVSKNNSADKSVFLIKNQFQYTVRRQSRLVRRIGFLYVPRVLPPVSLVDAHRCVRLFYSRVDECEYEEFRKI